MRWPRDRRQERSPLEQPAFVGTRSAHRPQRRSLTSPAPTDNAPHPAFRATWSHTRQRERCTALFLRKNTWKPVATLPTSFFGRNEVQSRTHRRWGQVRQSARPSPNSPSGCSPGSLRKASPHDARPLRSRRAQEFSDHWQCADRRLDSASYGCQGIPQDDLQDNP